MLGGAREIALSKRSCSSFLPSNMLPKVPSNMLSAKLSKEESNVASMAERVRAAPGSFRDEYLRIGCGRKPKEIGMWSPEKVLVANGASLQHFPIAKAYARR